MPLQRHPHRSVPAVFFALAFALATLGYSQDPVRYGRDIRPLLSERCFACHGADENARIADLRLDQQASSTRERDGGPAIVPGQPEASQLWKRLNHPSPAEHMPPASAKKRPFSAGELETIRAWIAGGAKYEDHWAFIPPKRQPSPKPPWSEVVRGPIDAHVFAKLHARGFAPSEPADSATLLRRLFLDLTGLPPTPIEVERFLAIAAPDAHDRWVDKLLNEEPWRSRMAERFAAPWLDASRFADTSGLHTDAGRSIWPWRDWVLHSFRNNLPFDRFLTEQLAGDLLPNATQDQKVATGFNRNHVTSDEGGAIIDELLVEYAVDRTATTGSVFLGLTVGCARCHDHKYDPISQSEFYGLFSYFNSVDEPGLYSQTQDVKRAHEPFLEVPTPEQRQRMAALTQELDKVREALNKEPPEETAAFNKFLLETGPSLGVKWGDTAVVSAKSRNGATLSVQADGSILASGINPTTDTHVIELTTSSHRLDALLLEAIPHASLPMGRVGRSDNGNAVLSRIQLEASTSSGTSWTPVNLSWAWADHSQDNGDFDVTNLLDGSGEGWALDGHRQQEARVALLMPAETIDVTDGMRFRVTLTYNSPYSQHVIGRTRLRIAELSPAARERLPTVGTPWLEAGPFAGDRDALFDQRSDADSRPVPPQKDAYAKWERRPLFRDTTVIALPGGTHNSYVARRLLIPTQRKLSVGVGSDDGIRVTVDAREVHSHRIDRGVQPDADRFTMDLASGEHALIMKIVNTGGEGGFYWKHRDPDETLSGVLPVVLLPADSRDGPSTAALRKAWRQRFSPEYLTRSKSVTDLEAKLATEQRNVPRTMVMREKKSPTKTFVLTRGQYDKPDTERPVVRSIPRTLGSLPPGAPDNRLGLAQWLTSADNPLVARVAVNRVWEWIFGAGLVRTSEDFGYQGEWPSHPELLDDLAVRFREGGWDLRALLREIVTSSTYRQSSRRREEVAAVDPDNRLLSWYPRRRLDAESLRDMVLSSSGLLVESFGGPSVYPEQPAGLWEEVSMLVSNTRVQQSPMGDDRYRRSLYTFWKRASPPPAMMTLDAPTRESCVIRRQTTNTPLQALALWNEAQFVEAARSLARAAHSAQGDAAQVTVMFQRVLARSPSDAELHALTTSLTNFRKRYIADSKAAAALVGREAPLESVADLAALTLLANALFNLDAAITRS